MGFSSGEVIKIFAKESNDIRLKVGELTDREDFGRGIARIDSKSLKNLGAKEGDIVEIEGKRKTVAVAVRSYPADVGLNLIRIDGLVRKNAGTSIGESVVVKKIEPKEAQKVVLAPVEKGLMLHVSPNLLKQNLFMRPVQKGDIIITNPVFKRGGRETDPLQDMLKRLGFDIEIGEVFIGGGETRLVVVKTSPDGPVQITDLTELELMPQAVEIEETKIPTVTYEDIGGMKEEVKKVREMIELPLKHPELFERLGVEPPKGVLLHGPPGCGKTLLAKAVANEAGAHFISVAGPEIVSKWYGGSEQNIRNIFEEAEKNAPSIIFFDEIDAIAPKREEVTGEVERRMVSQLLSLMDGLKSRGKVIVIAATNRPNALDPALRRGGRFDREIEIGIPNKEARKEILQIHTRYMPLEKDISLDRIAEITHGYVGADIATLTKEAAMHALRRVIPELSGLEEDKPIPKEVLEKLRVTKEDFDYALRMVQPSAMREVLVEVPKVKWEDVGGLEEVKRALKEVVEWPLRSPESFKKLGIKPPRGILLYGPPGCGKTHIVKALANEAGVNFISIKGPEVMTMWVGESERKVREVFRRAKQVAPSIIFFDEIDAIAPRRGSIVGTHVSEQVVSQLLTEMSGLEELKGVVVIAASVTGDTPIMIKDKEGIRIVSIAEFVDKYYAPNEEGVEKPVFNIQCLGFEQLNSNKFTAGLRFGNSAFKKVRGVFRHKVNEIYEIEFIGGKIRTTGNHSVFIRTKQGIEARPVSSLKPGDILVDLPYTPSIGKNRRAHIFDTNFNLELPIFEPDTELQNAYALDSLLSQHPIAAQIGFQQATVLNCHHGLCVPRDLSKKYFKHSLPESVKITPDLLRLFGYYVAEGYVRKELDFCFDKNEKHIIKDLKKLMKNIFGLEPDRIVNKTPNAINIIYHSKPLADFFARQCGTDAHFKHVPRFLFTAPFEYFKEFLRGYAAGNGSKDGRLEITSVSKQLIVELNWLCRMHGVKSYIAHFKKAGKVIYRLEFGKLSPRTKGAVIKGIKKVPFDGYVYDLCGCDNEAFFGGETPILLHNTNRPDMIDPALLRPGRFDQLVYVPAPDKDARLRILKVHTKGMPLKGVKLDKLAEKTEGFSGADLEALCREAAMNALRENIKSKEVSAKDFDDALKKIKPSITQDMFAKYHKVMEDIRKTKLEEEENARYIG